MCSESVFVMTKLFRLNDILLLCFGKGTLTKGSCIFVFLIIAFQEISAHADDWGPPSAPA